MELRHLRYFVAVAEELHFTRAATRLHISQPPLTQQIKALEEEVGTLLFVRKPRSIELTDAGKVLLNEATAILADVETATRRTRNAAKGIVGHLSLGYTEAATFHPTITSMMSRYRSAYPGIEMRLQESFSPDLLDSLRENQLQAVLVRPPAALAADMVYTELLAEERVVAVSEHHPLADKKHVELNALQGESFITYPRVIPPGFETPLGTRFEPRIGQKAPRISSTINLVAAGLGISIAPASVKYMRTEGVRYITLRGNLPPAVLGIAYRKSESSQAVLNFISIALAASEAAAQERTASS